MSTTIKKSFCIALLASSFASYAQEKNFGFPFFDQRPQVLNTARRMSGEVTLWNCYDMDRIHGTLSITPEYTRSFDRDELAKYLFFNGFNSMQFGPANAAGANPKTNVAAREFVLGDGFIADITAKPRVENVLVDIGFRLGLDEWVEGLYFDVHGPIDWTRWDMNFPNNETGIRDGGIIPAGQISTGTQTSPVTTIVEAWMGNAVVGDVKEPMRSAIVDGSQSLVRLADVELALGYNFILRPWMHLGTTFRVLAPTGNRPEAVYFFEPVAGDGKHTGIGAGLSGHFELWNNCCDQAFGIYFMANFYHLFRSTQKRTFDFKENGIGSRYLLLKGFTMMNNMPIYDNVIQRGPNITTLEAKVTVPFEADASVLFNYEKCGFTFDVGYNIWGRSAEQIKLTGEIDKDRWGIKGGTFVINMPDPMFPQNSRNQTNSRATITGANSEMDMFDTNTSGQPAVVFIKTDDLDIEGAEAPSALSHKVFAHLGYIWDNCDYSPFLGIGGEVEFSGREDRALDQWGIWAKGGFYYS